MPMKMVVIPYEKYMKLLNKENDHGEQTENVNKQNGDPAHAGNVKGAISQHTEKRIQGEIHDTPLNNKDDERNMTMENMDMLDEDDILEYMPKNYKNKCKSLILHMRKNNMSWNEKGQLVLGDECISKSHIVDILKDLTIPNKKEAIDLNSLQLNRLLHLTHCPKSILKNNEAN